MSKSKRYNLLNFVEAPTSGHWAAMRFQWALYELFRLRLSREEGVVSRQIPDAEWTFLVVMNDSDSRQGARISLRNAFSRARRVEFRMNRRWHQKGDTGTHGDRAQFMIVELEVFFYVAGKKPIATARYIFDDKSGACMDAHFNDE